MEEDCNSMQRVLSKTSKILHEDCRKAGDLKTMLHQEKLAVYDL